MKLQIVLSLICVSQCRVLWESPISEITSLENASQSEDKIQIRNLTGTLSKDNLSKLKVSELRIIKNQLRQIQDGALCPSKTLKILELDFSGNKDPPKLTKTMFDGCGLEEFFLKIDYNKPSSVEANFLENVQSLRNFAVDSLVLPHLKKKFLVLPPDLNKMVLSNIHLEKIDEDAFDGLPNLEELEIVHNLGLTQLSHCFKKLGKLRKLNLRDNALSSFTWEEFEGLKSLEELNLGDNLISNLNADKISKHMPKLKKLNIDPLVLSVSTLSQFENELSGKIGHKVEIPLEL